MSKADRRIIEVVLSSGLTEPEVREKLASGEWALCPECLYPTAVIDLIAVKGESAMCEGCADDYLDAVQSQINDDF